MEEIVYENIDFYENIKPVEIKSSRYDNLRQAAGNQRHTSQATTSFSTTTDSDKKEKPKISTKNINPKEGSNVTHMPLKDGISWQLGVIVSINFALAFSSLLIVLLQVSGKTNLLCSCTTNGQTSKVFIFFTVIVMGGKYKGTKESTLLFFGQGILCFT